MTTSRQQRRYDARLGRGSHAREAQATSPAHPVLEMRIAISAEDAASFPADENDWTARDHARFRRFVRCRETTNPDGEWLPLPNTRDPG